MTIGDSITEEETLSNGYTEELDFGLSTEKEEGKYMTNPYVEIYAKIPRIESIVKSKNSDIYNDYQNGKYYSPELFGFKSLRPFRNYVAEEREEELIEEEITDETVDEKKKKKKYGYITLKKIKKFKNSDDPIKFVQKFLIAFVTESRAVGKEVIYTTFKRYLDDEILRQCPHQAKERNPDDLIEAFVLNMAQWKHLINNVKEVKEKVTKGIEIVPNNILFNSYEEAINSIGVYKRMRYFKSFGILSQEALELFNTKYRKSRYDPKFDARRHFEEIAPKEIAVREEWFRTYKDADMINEMANIDTKVLQEQFNKSVYTDVSYNTLKKFILGNRKESKETKSEEAENVEVKNEKEENIKNETNLVPTLQNASLYYGRKLSEEEWKKDREIISRTNIYLKTRFTDNPYNHDNVFEQTRFHWTREAKEYFTKNNRCRLCGHKLRYRHICQYDSMIVQYRIHKPIKRT